RIGVAAGERDNFHTIMRMNGYQKALFEAGILYDPGIVEYVRWEREAGYKVAPTMISNHVSAVFCMSDTIAGGIYDYMREKGMTMSVAGYDNRAMADYMAPGLTTMALPLNEIGRQSAEKLIGILQGNAIEEHFEQRIPCTLIERESVTAIE
ncbi:MAG TPA: substrate-binding domain-containing protein, partial [Lachnospiraceae bacterium]|nr:substrate-binding domain-containing protein [Lachnospiraceae bacterium]